MLVTVLSLRYWFFLYFAAIVACLGCVFRVDKFHPPTSILRFVGEVLSKLIPASVCYTFCIVRPFDHVFDFETFYADGLIFLDYLCRPRKRGNSAFSSALTLRKKAFMALSSLSPTFCNTCECTNSKESLSSLISGSSCCCSYFVRDWPSSSQDSFRCSRNSLYSHLHSSNCSCKIRS